MSGYYDSDPDEFERGNSGSGLRKQLEDVIAENRKLREAIEGDKRQEAATALLKEKGLDPAVYELIPSDADPAKWLEEKAHLLGVKPKDQAEVQPGTEPEVVAPAEEDAALVAEREAQEAMQAAASSGTQSAAVTGDLLEQMSKVNTEEELMALFAANGGLSAD